MKRKNSKDEPPLKTVLGIDAKLFGTVLIVLGLLLYVITTNIKSVIEFLRWMGL